MQPRKLSRVFGFAKAALRSSFQHALITDSKVSRCHCSRKALPGMAPVLLICFLFEKLKAVMDKKMDRGGIKDTTEL